MTKREMTSFRPTAHGFHHDEWLADRRIMLAPEPEGATSVLRTYSLETLQGIAAALELAEATPTPDGSIPEGVRR